MDQRTDEETILSEKHQVRTLAALPNDANIDFIDIGWTSRVYLVNDGEIVFKFPRTEAVREEYKREIAVYQLARELAHDDVLVPEICWTHPAQHYLGYRGIVGHPLEDVIDGLAPANKRRIGEQLGAFLNRFHGAAMENAMIMTQAKECEEYAYKLSLVLPCLEQHFAPSDVNRIKRLVLEDYPAEIARLGFEQGLCHADLGLWNMIYTEDGKVGLIDFGDTGYYDTAIDFAGLTDPVLLEAALGRYERPILREKIAWRMRLMSVLDLPFFIGKQDQAGILQTIERIRHVLAG